MHPYLRCSFNSRSKATRADVVVVEGVEAAGVSQSRAADCRKAERILSYASFVSGHLIARSGSVRYKENVKRVRTARRRGREAGCFTDPGEYLSFVLTPHASYLV